MSGRVVSSEATMAARTLPTIPARAARSPLTRAAAVLAFAWLLACAPAETGGPATQPTPMSSDAVGSLTLGLTVSPGIHIDSVAYVITRADFQRAGSLDVRESTVIAGVVSALPVAAGYALTMTAADAGHAGITCQGTTAFDIVARQTTAVDVRLQCREPRQPPPPPSVPLPPAGRAPLALLLLVTGVLAARRARQRG
jgi:hypothetical protein